MNPHIAALKATGIIHKYGMVYDLFDRDTALDEVHPEYLRGVLDLAGRLWSTPSSPPEAIKAAFEAALRESLPPPVSPGRIMAHAMYRDSVRAVAEALADKVKYPPHHQHDCEQCVYLGHASTTHYEGRDNPIGGTPVDLYLCQKTRHDHALERFGSIIARYGEAGSYLSYPGFPETEAAARKNPLTREALERAEARGLLGKLRADQKDYITCGELVNLAGQGRSVFPIWVGDYEVTGKEQNLYKVLRLTNKTDFYVREYELLGTNTLRYAGEVLAKLDLQAPK